LASLIFFRSEFLPAMTFEEGIKDPRLKKAWEMIKTNRPIDSLQFLSDYQTNAETKTYYHFIYGRALEGIKKPVLALEHYRAAYLSAPPGELKELALLERAEGYLKINNYDEAKLLYSLFLTNFNKSKYLEKANLGLAQSLAGIGLLPEALKHYDKAGDRIETIFGKANILHRQGLVKEADEFYSKGILKNKIYFLNSEEILFYYGENLHQMGKDEESIQYLTKTIKNQSFKKKAELVLGQISLKARKYDEAQKYFYSALSSPDRLVRQEALFYLAEAHLGMGKKNEARQILQEYRLKYLSGKAHEEVLLKLAKLDMEGERFDQAAGWIRELILHSSLKKEILMELEGIFLRLKEKDPPRMVSLWNSMGQKFLDPSREPFLMIMTEALKGTGKPFSDLCQWLGKHGSEKVKIRSLIALVNYQVEVGDFNSASDGLKSLKHFKVSGDELVRLEARIFYAKLDYGAASDRLLSLKKMGAKDLSLLEDTLTSSRNINKALAVFEKNLLQLGGNSSGYIKLADILFDKGKKKEALQYYQKALEKDPLNEWALFRAGSLMSGEEAQKILARIKSENSLLGKLAKARQRENEVERKIREDL